MVKYMFVVGLLCVVQVIGAAAGGRKGVRLAQVVAAKKSDQETKNKVEKPKGLKAVQTLAAAVQTPSSSESSDDEGSSTVSLRKKKCCLASKDPQEELSPEDAQKEKKLWEELNAWIDGTPLPTRAEENDGELLLNNKDPLDQAVRGATDFSELRNNGSGFTAHQEDGKQKDL